MGREFGRFQTGCVFRVELLLQKDCAFSVGRRDFPTKKDIGNAKNCLTEERLILDDRFGQYSQVIRQPFFSGVPEYGDRVVSPYSKHLPNAICLCGMYN